MGFINQDSQLFEHLDITLLDCYTTIKAQCSIMRSLVNGETKYRISATAYTYASKDAYLLGRQPLKKEQIHLDLDDLVGVEPMNKLYEHLKTNLNNISDA